jgi:hypothetical protein
MSRGLGRTQSALLATIQQHGAPMTFACGSVFHRARADARYCSGPCRQRAYRRWKPALKRPRAGPQEARGRPRPLSGPMPAPEAPEPVQGPRDCAGRLIDIAALIA